MLNSMTGFGSAACRQGGLCVTVELKAVNNRYFKLSLRMSDGFASLEPKIEPLIRKTIERGTVNATIRIQQEKSLSDYRISETALTAYFEQILNIGSRLEQGDVPPRLDRLVTLPGVVETDLDHRDEENEKVWTVLETAIQDALDKMQTMRLAEGESMRLDLKANIDILRELVENIERLSPGVPAAYRQRLTERIGKLMSDQNLTLADADLVREVALFADRCDISEETVRFRSHLEQFESAMAAKESCGRKLDFLTQELFRETNTMGSKANDAEITRYVVEMKTVIERIREMVQNVE